MLPQYIKKINRICQRIFDNNVLYLNILILFVEYVFLAVLFIDFTNVNSLCYCYQIILVSLLYYVLQSKHCMFQQKNTTQYCLDGVLNFILFIL